MNWNDIECRSEEAQLIREEWFGCASNEIPEEERKENLSCGWRGWKTFRDPDKPILQVICIACERVFNLLPE